MDANVASQPKLHLQQSFPLFYLQSNKHPKTTKLNLDTPWMKKKTNIDYYCFLPSMNYSKFMEIQYFFFFF
jgi:hypothetical protein